MAKRNRISEYDQFIVRMPPGLRARIKAKADLAGLSMNEAIVRVLEHEFPQPRTMERRVSQLLTSLTFLKGIGDADYIVDDLIKGVRETLDDIAAGKVEEADERQRQMVADSLRKWDQSQGEDGSSSRLFDKLRRPGPPDHF